MGHSNLQCSLLFMTYTSPSTALFPNKKTHMSLPDVGGMKAVNNTLSNIYSVLYLSEVHECPIELLQHPIKYICQCLEALSN